MSSNDPIAHDVPDGSVPPVPPAPGWGAGADDGPEPGSLKRPGRAGDGDEGASRPAGAASVHAASVHATSVGAAPLDPVPSDEVPFEAVPGDARAGAPYGLRPRLRAVALGFLVHHNPFYLLSALCMIAGCYTLNAGLGLRSGEVGRVLGLVGTLAAYELLLVGLGLFLIRGRGLVRDGRTLLLLQAAFLADLTFLNAETVTADLRVGLLVNAALLLLAWAKVAAALWVLAPRAAAGPGAGAGAGAAGGAGPGRPRVAFPWRGFAMAALMLGVLFALPCAFRLAERDGRVGGGAFHLAWWVVGLLPVACEALRFAGRRAGAAGGAAGSPAGDPAAGGAFGGGRPRVGPVYVGLAFASVVAHLGMLHWVYRGRFHLADLSPVLLGLGVAVAYRRPTRAVDGSDLRQLRLALPAAALLCAAADPRPLDLALGAGGRLDVRSVHLALAGAYAAVVYAFLWRHVRRVAAATVAAAGVALFGPTPGQVWAAADAAWDRAAAAAWAVLPKTAVGWGAAAVGSAFALLGAGAVVSLSQGKRPGPAAGGDPGAAAAGGPGGPA